VFVQRRGVVFAHIYVFFRVLMLCSLRPELLAFVGLCFGLIPTGLQGSWTGDIQYTWLDLSLFSVASVINCCPRVYPQTQRVSPLLGLLYDGVGVEILTNPVNVTVTNSKFSFATPGPYSFSGNCGNGLSNLTVEIGTIIQKNTTLDCYSGLVTVISGVTNLGFDGGPNSECWFKFSPTGVFAIDLVACAYVSKGFGALRCPNDPAPTAVYYGSTVVANQCTNSSALRLGVSEWVTTVTHFNKANTNNGGNTGGSSGGGSGGDTSDSSFAQPVVFVALVAAIVAAFKL